MIQICLNLPFYYGTNRSRQLAALLRPGVNFRDTDIGGIAVHQQTGDQIHELTRNGLYPYTIHVNSFRDKKRSNDLALELRDQGAPAFTCPSYIPGKGDWYRVFVGHYETLEETREAASKLKGQQDLYPLEARMPYAVQVWTFDSDLEAKALESDLRSKAYLAYSIPDETDPRKIRLMIGAYRTEKDAARLTQKLHEQGFNSEVVRR